MAFSICSSRAVLAEDDHQDIILNKCAGGSRGTAENCRRAVVREVENGNRCKCSAGDGKRRTRASESCGGEDELDSRPMFQVRSRHTRLACLRVVTTYVAARPTAGGAASQGRRQDRRAQPRWGWGPAGCSLFRYWRAPKRWNLVTI